jgi:hypothetical protein
LFLPQHPGLLKQFVHRPRVTHDPAAIAGARRIMLRKQMRSGRAACGDTAAIAFPCNDIVVVHQEVTHS